MSMKCHRVLIEYSEISQCRSHQGVAVCVVPKNGWHGFCSLRWVIASLQGGHRNVSPSDFHFPIMYWD